VKNLEEMIHSDSFYELEFHKTRCTQEHRYIKELEPLLERSGYRISEQERHELDHIRGTDGLIHKIIVDTIISAKRALERGRFLFQDTSTEDRECHFPENA